MNNKKYNRSWLIKELSERGGFGLEDCDIFLTCFEDILVNIIKEHKSITISNLFHMHVKKIKTHQHWNPGKKQYELNKDGYTISFRPSKTLKDAAKTISEIKE